MVKTEAGRVFMSGGSVVVPERQTRSDIVEALNREWCVLVRAHRGTAMQWAGRYRVLTGCGSLDDVVLRAAQQPDAVLGALLAEVAIQDQIAARTVLQSMIGRIVRMAWRDPQSDVDLYLSALWCVIAKYPLHRRPTKISGNLSMDTLKLVSAERRWLRTGEVTTWAPAGFLDPEFELEQIRRHGGDPNAGDVLGAGLELGLIDGSAYALLKSVYVDGLSSAEAAQRHRSSATSVRVRCSRALRGLSEHACELAGVA